MNERTLGADSNMVISALDGNQNKTGLLVQSLVSLNGVRTRPAALNAKAATAD
jgi:hypothetical protein